MLSPEAPNPLTRFKTMCFVISFVILCFCRDSFLVNDVLLLLDFCSKNEFSENNFWENEF